MKWFRLDAKSGLFELDVHAQPNAARSRCVGLHGDAVKIQVAAVPEDGRANAALCAFVADRLGLAARAVRVVRGATARRKTLAIDGLVPGTRAEAVLERLMPG